MPRKRKAVESVKKIIYKGADRILPGDAFQLQHGRGYLLSDLQKGWRGRVSVIVNDGFGQVAVSYRNMEDYERDWGD